MVTFKHTTKDGVNVFKNDKLVNDPEVIMDLCSTFLDVEGDLIVYESNFSIDKYGEFTASLYGEELEGQEALAICAYHLAYHESILLQSLV